MDNQTPLMSGNGIPPWKVGICQRGHKILSAMCVGTCRSINSLPWVVLITLYGCEPGSSIHLVGFVFWFWISHVLCILQRSDMLHLGERSGVLHRRIPQLGDGS